MKRYQCGFTLAELVAVMVIAAILAVSATSLFDRRTFDTATYANEVRAQLSYAQKLAVAARRPVTVTVAGNAVALSMCPDFLCTLAAVPVVSPRAVSRDLPPNVTLTPDTSFQFNPNGTASAAVTLTVSGAGNRNITVQPLTGYVQ